MVRSSLELVNLEVIIQILIYFYPFSSLHCRYLDNNLAILRNVYSQDKFFHLRCSEHVFSSVYNIIKWESHSKWIKKIWVHSWLLSRNSWFYKKIDRLNLFIFVNQILSWRLTVESVNQRWYKIQNSHCQNHRQSTK